MLLCFFFFNTFYVKFSVIFFLACLRLSLRELIAKKLSQLTPNSFQVHRNQTIDRFVSIEIWIKTGFVPPYLGKDLFVACECGIIKRSQAILFNPVKCYVQSTFC